MMKYRRFFAAVIGWLLCIAAVGMFIFPWSGKKQSPYAERDKDGNIMIKAESLFKDKVSFIRIEEESRIELLAILGENGEIRIAFGACQSCNGSPYAYYTQKGDRLICNNCGASLPISELGEPGGGCHPIMIPEELIHKTEEGLVLETDGIMEYEKYFEKVIAH